jgi:hypothetical protein
MSIESLFIKEKQNYKIENERISRGAYTKEVWVGEESG